MSHYTDNVDQDEEKSEEWDWTQHTSPSISQPFEEFLNDTSGTMRTTFYEDQDEEKSEEWYWTQHRSPSISHPFEEFLNDPSGTMRTTFYESSKTNLTTTRLTTDFVSSPEVNQCGDKPGSKDKSVSDDSNWSLSMLCSNHSVSVKVNLELPMPTWADSSVDSVLSPKIKLHSTDQSLPPEIDQTSDEPEVEEEEYLIPDDCWFDYLESIDKLVKRKNGVYFQVCS